MDNKITKLCCKQQFFPIFGLFFTWNLSNTHFIHFKLCLLIISLSIVQLYDAVQHSEAYSIYNIYNIYDRGTLYASIVKNQTLLFTGQRATYRVPRNKALCSAGGKVYHGHFRGSARSRCMDLTRKKANSCISSLGRDILLIFDFTDFLLSCITRHFKSFILFFNHIARFNFL